MQAPGFSRGVLTNGLAPRDAAETLAALAALAALACIGLHRPASACIGLHRPALACIGLHRRAPPPTQRTRLRAAVGCEGGVHVSYGRSPRRFPSSTNALSRVASRSFHPLL